MDVVLNAFRARRAKEYGTYMWVYWMEGSWPLAYACARYVLMYGRDVDRHTIKLAGAIVCRMNGWKFPSSR